jgi:alpha-glucosidase
MDMSATTSESAQFTVPASADEGPNLLPNVKNSTAVQAQSVCPGYTASDVEHTTNGFKATLNLAGDAVRIVVKSEHLPI